jgi:predicted nucleic acid-binding protein
MTGNERCFVDSNIWIYAATQSEAPTLDPRHSAARALISDINPYISTQVINEVSINLIRKFKFSEAHLQTLTRSFYQKYMVCQLDEDILLKASMLRISYCFSFWDSIIVSTALQHQCSTLYTEDMGDNLVVDDALIIVNPFREITKYK